MRHDLLVVFIIKNKRIGQSSYERRILRVAVLNCTLVIDTVLTEDYLTVSIRLSGGTSDDLSIYFDSLVEPVL